MKEVLEKANERHAGRKLTSYDFQALCWKEGLRDDPKYAWKHRNGPSHVWSGDAVSHLAGVSDTELDGIRAEYRAHLNAAKASN